jgi:hypothetical protein
MFKLLNDLQEWEHAWLRAEIVYNCINFQSGKSRVLLLHLRKLELKFSFTTVKIYTAEK